MKKFAFLSCRDPRPKGAFHDETWTEAVDEPS